MAPFIFWNLAFYTIIRTQLSFWGMVKSEMYYLRKFYTYEELEAAVIEYIDYYNTRRYQKRLNCMTPLEYRQYLLSSAA
ncbi:putative transposase InsK for insertion sequence element IS150 [Paenibacillus larvae subsp. larvae]|uniref:Putative transposase InsK for insertion sequence element IS150 n=1 Tax=Paenibacillus larvae subsp. larvae TaxID=147375 RepID=A0A2L1UIN0_9BACL|nr:IS3 family transposase [Paenibacillus larvae]AQT84563.1 hypothetical protein B1222_09465 [Paenibacillus larvae subsp. pulvifaciens]AVF28280.1 putative transposase InsK for insertion sequence element IS150 [Paenibacillus larvae subsp. larvae]AVF32783.1 putative transposase InsK for insertion sequence element IS150 [Paenibacillus larvae subsp. larvae]MDR5607877.1 IS3 family transposase [Paenibacillus larvae]